MRIKDFLKFLVCAVLFLVGLNLLSRYTTPPKPEEKPEDKPAAKQEATASPATAAGGFAAYLALQDKLADDVRRTTWAAQQPRWHQLGAAAGAGWAASGKRWPEAPTAERKMYTLGSKDSDSPFHLEVQFDPRGAAVRSITLNKFKAMTRLGHPSDEPFKLVPFKEDLGEHTFASNVLYHYDIDRADAKRPFDTLGNTEWQVAEVKNGENEDEQVIRFVTVVKGIEVTKTFRLPRRGYHLALEVGIRRTEQAPKNAQFRYQLTGTLGLPIEGEWYTSTYRHALIGILEKGSLVRNYQDSREIALKLGGEDEKRGENRGENRYLLYAGVAVQYFASVIAVDSDQKDQKFLASARPTLEARSVNLELTENYKPGDTAIKVPNKNNPRQSETYILNEAVQDQLFRSGASKGSRFAALVVPDSQDQQVVVKILPEGEGQPQFNDDITVRVNTEAVELPASTKESVVHRYLLYNGPVKPKLLGQMTGDKAVADEFVDLYLDKLHLNTLTDYRSPGFFGGFASTIYLTNLIIFFTNLCHEILSRMHTIIPSYGICIILLTVLVRGIMFPLSRKQALTSLKMQSLQPELKKLKEKFGDDRHGFAMAQMELFRKNNVSMFGSCWMLLLQMPIFMGLYYCLQESVHFRLAGFLWIDNLGAPDMLLKWGENIPLLSRREDIGSILYLGPYLNILPIIAVSLMIYQQRKMMPPPADEQQAMQQKMMKYMMIFFGLMFYKVAAGLCVYFIASSLWGFMERKLLPKLKPSAGGESADRLFQQMTGNGEPAKVESKAITNGDRASNRAKRRQERKRKQDRTGTQITTEAPPVKTEEAVGWWSNMRRKVGDWWKDVLKKAAKK